MTGRKGPLRFTRRGFIAAGSGAAIALALSRLGPLSSATQTAAPTTATGNTALVYGDWRDVYRDRWSWDRVVKSSHFTNCWYQSHCAWNVYVKDGVVWREEQVADYPQSRPDVPDFNPRGCQKGACYSERMYDQARVTYPLKRVGPRGGGRWKRVGWEEALTDLAEEFVTIATEEGSNRVVWDNGPLFTFGAMAAAQTRFVDLTGCISLDMNTEIGDGHRGAAETFGKIVFERSADDYFNSDLILIWGCNPFATQIPNAHFLTEARYNGARLVTIAPDYSPSSIHSDAWLQVHPGSDAALALAMCRVVIDEQLYDRAFVREQTDLPMLVRSDTGLLLRQSDLQRGGEEEIFYRWDETSAGAVEAPRDSLALAGVKPALEGSYQVATLGGNVTVRPVFELLRERLADYSPEQAARICGTAAGEISRLARAVAHARAATNVTTSNFAKYYHGNLVERAQALLFSLCGHIGKKGGGFVAFPFLTNDAFDLFVRTRTSAVDTAKLYADFLPRSTWLKWKGYTEEMVAYEFARDAFRRGQGFACGVLFWATHGGLLEYSGRSGDWDPYMKRPLGDYLDESLNKGWQHVWPPRDSEPRMLFSFGSNLLRRVRAYPLLLKTLWPKLRRVAVMDWRMTSTGQWADYVLPVSGWYERDDHKWATPLSPFLHAGRKAVEIEEAWHEWRIFHHFTRIIGEVAQRRGVDRYSDHLGRELSLAKLHREFTWDHRYGERDESLVAGELVERSTNLGDAKWKDVQDKGYVRFSAPGGSAVSVGNATEFADNDTITPLTEHVHGKMPYPTTTRRIQFYIDHPFYMELDEALPRHKDPPRAGGDYPLMLTGGHTRWSIHSQWRDDALMLQQQRGVPVVYIGVEDAKSRGVADGDDVLVRNDLDSFRIQAKVSPAVRPGQLIIYHAWENYQFAGGKGFQNLIPSPINPVELAGGQYHLRPMIICLQPGQFDRDTRVEVEKT